MVRETEHGIRKISVFIIIIELELELKMLISQLIGIEYNVYLVVFLVFVEFSEFVVQVSFCLFEL